MIRRRMAHCALLLWFSLVTSGVCYGEDWKAKVAALRPVDTRAGEAAVLDLIAARAAAALGAVRHAATAAEADRARPALRAKIRASLGFERLPRPNLAARTIGTVSRSGYRIEKIVFQALPGMEVPAHLYVPDNLRERVPAILFYSGHWWPDSKTRPEFQAFCINMARLGFVILAWDPFGQGERGISSRDHRRVEGLLVGVAQQGFAEHETRAALDYLLGRPEVDPKSIGMTGASGGGYNTWVTSALDDRIAVAVPVVGTSEFLEQIRVTRPLDWYHASEHCHFVPGLIRYANNHELLAMVAPRPLLVIAASRDQSFPIEGVREIADYGRKLYSAYGATQKFGFFEDSTEGHGYQKAKREAAYGWFLRWLKGVGDGRPYPEPETAIPPFDAADLRVFPIGSNQPAGPPLVEAARRLSLTPPREKLRLAEVLGISGPVRARRVELPAGAVTRVLIPVDKKLDVPGFVIRPTGIERGLLLALDDRGKEAALADLPVDMLLERGWALAGVDPRGLGELQTAQRGWVAAVSLLAGENFVGWQALDLAHAAGALAPKSIGIYARGENAALAATYFLASGPKVRFFIVRDGFVTLRHFLERPASLALSFRLQNEDRDRTSAFDREIPFAYVPFRGLEGPDITDLWSAAKTDGLLVNPIDGDWQPIGSVEAARMVPPRIRVVSGVPPDSTLREFLQLVLR
jgi:dienelactone hydrolase